MGRKWRTGGGKSGEGLPARWLCGNIAPLEWTGRGFFELRNPGSMSQYLLAPHVHLCVTEDHAVLLDLKRDKYVGIASAQMRALQQCVKGWPAVPRSAESGSGELPARPDSLLSKMLASGMLTTDASRGKEAAPTAMPKPQSTLDELDPGCSGDVFETRPPVSLRHVLNFILACSAARLSLRFRSIASVVARAARRKARHARSQPALDLQAARRHVAAYVYLRPLLFTARDACLFDALALTNYLARFGIFATWVFGVQTGPFAAHSWVQHEDIVLNDTPDNVRRYAPILAI